MTVLKQYNPDTLTWETIVTAQDGPPGVQGDQGPVGDPGISIGTAPPDNTNVLWADENDEGDTVGGQTVKVHVYTDEAAPRPDVSVVFWVPSPVTLGNPFAAIAGDCVLRTSENPVQGINGIIGLWQGTPTEWETLPSLTADTVYFVKVSPP